MSKKRQNRSPEEKFKIAMAGIRGDFGSIVELSNHYGITQADYYRWRDILASDGARLYERGGVARSSSVLRPRTIGFGRHPAA